MTEDDGGKYKTSCTILDDADRISKILIKVNGKKFHCINIETTIKDGKEKSAYDKEISVAEHDIKNRVIYHRNEYAATESRKEDTLTENEIEEKLSELAKNDSSPKNGQEEKLTAHEKDSTTSDIGTEDTVTVHAKENILNDDEPEYELNHYGVEKTLTKQANNEEQNITVCAVHGGKCTRMPISFKHIFKWQVWPENKLILVLNIIHECDITVLIAGIGRSVECTSIITVMKCKECQTLCMNVISEDNQCINHFPVRMYEYLEIYFNRKKNYITVFHKANQYLPPDQICAISTKTDGVYMCYCKQT